MPGLRLLFAALLLAAAPAASASVDAVTRLPPEVEASIRAAAEASPRPPLARLQWLVQHLFAADGFALAYDNSRTRSVAETLAERRGNCLSFTLTFVALARAVGLDARLQESDRNQLWLRDDDTLFHARHMNAVVRIGHRRFVADFDRDLPLLRTPARIVDDTRGLAHYFNNRGAERMAEGDLDDAESLFARAIALDPGLVSSWNNRGVLRLRRGDPEGAESDWRRALRLDTAHAPALSNLLALYRRQGRLERVPALERRLQQAQRRDPFHQFLRAMEHERAGRHLEALAHYRTALRLQRDEPLFQLGAARMLEALGERREAARLRERARRGTGALGLDPLPAPAAGMP